jgi:hypothetical protein
MHSKQEETPEHIGGTEQAFGHKCGGTIRDKALSQPLDSGSEQTLNLP